MVNGFNEQYLFINEPPQACVWTGTADSVVNLSPAGVWSSEAHGVRDGIQVGWTEATDGVYAALWRGTADSYTDKSLRERIPPRHWTRW